MVAAAVGTFSWRGWYRPHGESCTLIRNLSRSRFNAGQLCSGVYRLDRSVLVLTPPGFVQPCQPALADRPPSGPGWACGLGLEGIVSKARSALGM